MTKDNMILDQDIREHALDPGSSFIVQAPAGSGKTELLTQRYLKLLALANKAPEEIIAITFTKKAASEMRTRILMQLASAKNNPEPELPHQQQTWRLARAVLEKSEASNWGLLHNPNRLRIQTIDSLCAYLTRQMPLLSHFGSQPEITEEPYEYYSKAVDEMLSRLHSDYAWSDFLITLLRHLDNRVDTLKRLLITMLSNRDQWLPHVLQDDTHALRQEMEIGLQHIITDTLTEVLAATPKAIQFELMDLLCFANDYLKTPLKTLDKALPGNTLSDLDAWKAIAHLLLKKDGSWRKTVTNTIGFPAPSKAKEATEKTHFAAMKKRAVELLTDVEDEEDFRKALIQLSTSPAPAYEDPQWNIVEALIQLLPILVAHLTIIFRQSGLVDFIQITHAALEALGQINDPSDLALKLDYQIQHLLVDEFQDTALPQYHLLEKLTAGWENGDGRTLFLVGDPMQSIYRFRQAEVGLFIKTQQSGLGELYLEPLRLTSNFRSSPKIVNWINEHFDPAFPESDHIEKGAISYHPSNPTRASITSDNINLHPVLNNELAKLEEAEQVVNIIKQTRVLNPDATIAILVRARSHLREILPALQAADLLFQAIDLEALIYQPTVQDLLSLTRAYLHLADRIAWLSILRAPWCGLTLKDLYCISADKNKTIWENLIDNNIQQCLSDDGQIRLKRILPVLKNMLYERGRYTLRQTIEKTWTYLGGPATLTSEKALNDAQAYLNFIERLDDAGDVADFDQLEKKLYRLFAKPNPLADDKLQVMTIHKAKGLEFDSVIIPGLSRKTAHDSSPLLYWMERTRLTGDTDLILAPIKSASEDSDPIYEYIRKENSKKAIYESGRLLYVATTRTKQNLHLIATLTLDEESGVLKAPPSTSLLSHLWDTLESDLLRGYAEKCVGEKTDSELEPELTYPSINRLPSTWKLPAYLAPPALEEQSGYYALNQSSTSQEHAKILGTVIHALLEQISIVGIEAFLIDEHLPSCLASLKSKMNLPSDIEPFIKTIKTCAKNIMRDPKAIWILDQKHTHAHSEYPLSFTLDNEIKHIIIDRTFIDDNGDRWIIDYKTSLPHEGERQDDFLAREKTTYQEQLHTYALAMDRLENNPIKLGLYFPLCQAWLAWDFAIQEEVTYGC